jgi:sigma-B regulation protein RsbU (phosphoserine phosphatase)
MLEPGSSLVLYTDGIPEAINSNNEAFSENRLRELFRGSASISSNKLIKNIINEVYTFTEDKPQSDDITTLVLKRNL